MSQAAKPPTNSALEGRRVPRIVFRTRRDNDWADLDSEQIFAGRTVAVFALPGAFTPTCSTSHVPRYSQLAAALAARGVDEIVCVSVNDAFVMNQWQHQQQAQNITFLPDGNAEFTRAMGMLVDQRSLGFGSRSRRYSMLVRDGVIEKAFVEADEPGDPYAVSDADTMLAYLAPDAHEPLDVTVFTREGCGYCARAKGMLRDAGIGFEERVLNQHISERTLRAVSGATSVPQVYVDGRHIGDSQALAQWLQTREAA